MEAARYYPHEADAGFDSSYNSQLAQAIPLSQLSPRPALPGLSQLYDGRLLLGDPSQGGILPFRQFSAAPQVGGLLGLPLPPLGPLPPLAPAGSTALPPLNQFEANGVGSQWPRCPDGVHGVVTLDGVAGAGAAGDHEATAAGTVGSLPTAALDVAPSPTPSPAALTAPASTSSPAALPTLREASKPAVDPLPASAAVAAANAAPGARSAVKARRSPNRSAASQPPLPAPPPPPLPSPPAVRSSTGSALSTALSDPASSTPAAPTPARGVQQAVPISLGPGGLGLMQAIASLGRQLVDNHRGPVKLTGFYVVVQASTGVKGDCPKNIIVDCHGDKRTVEEKDMIMAEWQQQRVARKGVITKAGGAPAVQKLSRPPPKNSVSAGVHTSGGSGESGSDDADNVVYPDVDIHSPKLMLSLPALQKGARTLSLQEFGAVVSSCKLRTYKQMTYNLVKGIFKNAQDIIISRGTRKGDFAWSRVTPLDLLMNIWSIEGSSLTVSGGCFIPPDSGNGGQRGGVEKKRIALCIAAHLCPFWSAILRGYFMDNPVNRVALAKRFRRADNAFANAGGTRARREKRRKLSCGLKANGADAGSGDNKTQVQSDDDYDVDNPLDDEELPVTAVSISELAHATSLHTCEDLLLLDCSPQLPSSTILSASYLPAAEFEAVRRAEAKLKVVLPRELIKLAFSLLATVNESGEALELDAQHRSSTTGDASASDAAPARSQVVSITVGEHPPMRCSIASIAHMSSVLSLNEQLKQCTAFQSWILALSKSDAGFPWELEFLVGSRLPVSAAADQVWSACAQRRVGDSAWRFCMETAGAMGDKVGSDLYGGCTVAFSDIITGGQRAYMTNGVLDAALVEMRHHGALRLMPGYVLLTGQSAAFTTSHNKRVSEEDAVRKIKEVYDVMPPARYERFLMMLNLMGHHWISAEVLPQGTIRIFDSSAGGFQEEKDFAVARVELFAQEIARLRRLRNLWVPEVDTWEVIYVNAPVQGDGYNCGPFALAHLWCAANGFELEEMTNVVGDHIRLGILWSILECGKRYDDARQLTMAPTKGSL